MREKGEGQWRVGGCACRLTFIYLRFNVFHNKDDLMTGKLPEPLVKKFLFTIKLPKNTLRRVSKYTVLPNRKKTGFQYVVL